MKGEALRSDSSAGASGAARFVAGLLAKTCGFTGTLGFAALLTIGASFGVSLTGSDAGFTPNCGEGNLGPL